MSSVRVADVASWASWHVRYTVCQGVLFDRDPQIRVRPFGEDVKDNSPSSAHTPQLVGWQCWHLQSNDLLLLLVWLFRIVVRLKKHGRLVDVVAWCLGISELFCSHVLEM